jgi:hypothetical protein
MDEPIYSPDGNFIWDGEQWVPTTSHNKPTVNMQDSVIGGDVVSNTNIQSSDAEVIKAAMEGVVASIRELNKPQIVTENPPLVAEENTEPAVVFVPAPHFPAPKQVSKSPIPIPPKKILVAVSIVGLLLITTVLTVLFLGGDDESHPIEGRWYMIGPPENEYIEFKALDGEICDGTWEAAEDSNRDGLITEDEIEARGSWSCGSNEAYAGENTGIIEWWFIDQDGNLDGPYDVQYHVSKNLFVWDEANDGNDDSCDPWIREGFQQSESSMQVQADLAIPPSFCVLGEVDW